MDEVDAVVIGSGFGGSVAAARLAEAGKSVVVLERGKAYPPGSFARSPYDMARSFWDPSKGLHGMFDLWSFSDIDAVVSAGLGGGSLIYANVMIRKDEHWFVQEDPRSGPGYEYWPVNREQLDPDYDIAERMLGATFFPFEFAPYSMAPKTQAMKSAAAALIGGGRRDLTWQLPKLAVYFGGDTPAPSTPFIGESYHGPTAFRRGCRLCGECDIGCNDGAKNSLDYNYLTLAHQKGADIRVRHDVKEFEHHPKGGYVVRYRDLTDYEGVDGKHAPRGELRCKVLVVSAGALGSTYLMLENEQRLGGLPSALGTKFCGNGDLLGFVRTRDGRVLAGTRGPVITSTMRVDDEVDPGGAGTGRGFYLQDGGYPGFADWIVETTSLPNRVWRSLKLGATLLANRIRHHRTNHLSLAVSQLVGALVGLGGLAPDARHGARRARRRDAARRRLARDRLERGELARVLLAGQAVDGAGGARARRRVDREPDVVAQAGGHGASARRLPDGHPRRVAAGGRAGRAWRRRRPRRGVRSQRPVRGGRVGDAGPGRAQPVTDDRRAGGAVQPADDRARG